MTDQSDLRVLYVTSVCDPSHTISASAFWWADALAARCKSVDVIALDTGGQPRPNMRLHPLHRSQRASPWFVVPRFAALLARLVPTVDVIFCQYSSKFVFAAWPFAVLRRKPIVLWWSHGHVDWRLRLATRMVQAVATSSQDSFRIQTFKKQVIGHGVDVEMFSPRPMDPSGADLMPGRSVRVLSIGRVTPLKDVSTMIEAAGLLKARGVTNFVLDLVGDTGRPGDSEYLVMLKQRAAELELGSLVRFIGPVRHDQTVELLRDADIFVNAQAAGGVGRAWLEAMSVATPVVLCTSAIDNVLSEADRRRVRFRDHDPEDLADRLQELIQQDPSSRRELGLRLREIVVRDHNLEHLADGLHALLHSTARSDSARRTVGG